MARLVLYASIAAAAIAVLLCAGGCSARNDIGYNPYAPSHGDPTVLELTDGGMDALEAVVRDLDVRLENAVY